MSNVKNAAPAAAASATKEKQTLVEE